MNRLTLCLAILLISAISLETTAQSAERKPDKERMEQMKTQMEEDMQQMELSESQKEAFREINKKYGEQMRNLRTSTADRRTKMEEVKSMSESRDSEMKTILTDEQFVTYKEIQQRRRESMKGRRP